MEYSRLCFSLKLLLVLLASSSLAQTPPDKHDLWAGHRIVALKGFGDYFADGGDGRPRLVKPEGLGVNMVAVVDHSDGDRVWIRANGAGDTPVGWIQKGDAVLLEDSVSYFTSLIGKNAKDWDSYLRRAEGAIGETQRNFPFRAFVSAFRWKCVNNLAPRAL